MHHLKLDETVILSIPFLWYREEQIYCPVDFVREFSREKFIEVLNKITNIEDGIIDEIKNFDKFNIVIQRNVLEGSNIYVCCHSFAFYEEFVKNNDTNDSIITIPNTLNKNYTFYIKCIPIDIILDSENYSSNILSIDMKQDEYLAGPVYIHDSAFSPPGVFKFRVNEDKRLNILLVFIKSVNFDKCVSLFFIVDGLVENDIFEKIISNLEE